MGAGRPSYAGAILPLIERFVGGRPEIGEAEGRAWAAEQRELAERGQFFFPALSSASALRAGGRSP